MARRPRRGAPRYHGPMNPSRFDDLVAAASRGDLPTLQNLLRESGRADLDRVDGNGCTVLTAAIPSPRAGLDVLQCLVDHGADVNRWGLVDSPYGRIRAAPAMAALRRGDPAVLRWIIAAGADLRWAAQDGHCTALTSAVYAGGSRLVEQLTLLIAHDAPLDGESSHGESALSVAANRGRFDAVHCLLEAGADPAPLRWTPLMTAVALGTLADVHAQIDAGAALEVPDAWERTAWHIAIQSGDIDKAALVRDRGSNIHARGRCGRPPLFDAVECGHLAMLRWLIELGLAVDEADEFGGRALAHAAECDNVEAAALLIASGAALNPSEGGHLHPLYNASSRAMVNLLLDAGADPRELRDESRRLMVGLPAEGDSSALHAVTPDQFAQGAKRTFGTTNPTRVNLPFRMAMVTSGVTAYAAGDWFTDGGFDREPIWCAHRFGTSVSRLADGRIVWVAGEHEDAYDPDFCIYNDVIVFAPDGGIEIFDYPESVFPPTDFHTATVVGDAIWLIGSLGYHGRRQPGPTQVMRLDTVTMAIEQVSASGPSPGWLSGHRAHLRSPAEIVVSEGNVLSARSPDEQWEPLARVHVFDTVSCRWRLEEAG